MLTPLLIIIVCMAGLLIVYHHFGYPYLLSKMAKNKKLPPRQFLKRAYQSNLLDQQLPTIEIIIPIHNEAEVIIDKIINCAILDYPHEKLTITLIFDGCTDNSVKLARDALTLPECQHLNVELIEKAVNEGKLSAINSTISASTADIIMLTDASALLSIDGLLIAASYFCQNDVGVVVPSYRFLNSGSEGEQQYWSYQTAILEKEAAIKGALGAHGPCYFFKRQLFTPLATGTINDDFILPMKIAAKGYRIIYDPALITTELESATLQLDQARRQRIAAGNLQQLIHLSALLHPKFGIMAFTFASGKALRVIMPLCLLVIFFGSFILSFNSPLFLLLLIVQMVFYGIALYRQYHLHKPTNTVFDMIHYFVIGHFTGLTGALAYLLGKYDHPWKRAKETLKESDTTS